MSLHHNTDTFKHCKGVIDACRTLGDCANISDICKAAVIDDRMDVNLNIIVAFAGFTVLAYDHILTFSDEVEHIWMKTKSIVGYLFLANRYIVPVGFIIDLYAYQWYGLSDRKFVRYEGALTVFGINIAGLMMLFRVRALYNNDKRVVGFLAVLLIVEFVVNVVLLIRSSSVHHFAHNSSCSIIFSIRDKPLSSGSAWLPLLYETAVFILTLYRTTEIRSGNSSAARNTLVRALRREGLAYYSVVFTITSVLTITISVSEDGTKNIAAQLELLLTVAMMSRITLDLKKRAQNDEVQCDVPTIPEVGVSSETFLQWPSIHDPEDPGPSADSFPQEPNRPYLMTEVGSRESFLEMDEPCATDVEVEDATLRPACRRSQDQDHQDKFKDDLIEMYAQTTSPGLNRSGIGCSSSTHL